MEKVLYPLPDGWSWQQLSDVVDKTENLNPLKHADQLWTYIDISSVDRDRFTITDPKEILGKDAPSRAKKHIQLNDVIFATTRPNLKNIALIREEYSSPVASTGFCIFRANEKVLPTYLFYFVTTDFVQAQIEPYVGGASYPAITDANLKKAPIPIPSIEEQKRIVEKLDTLLTRIDTAIEHLQESITLTDSMFVSGMDKAFNPLSLPPNETGLYELPKEWVWQNLGSISTIGTGVTPLKGRADYYNNGHISWVTSKATGDDFVFESEQKITEVALSECRLKLFPAGTLIVALYGQGKTRGQVSELLIESTINQALAAVVVNPDHNSKFVKYFLKRSYLLLRSKASGGTQENLNLSIIKAIQVPLPDIQQQRKIVLSLDALNDQVNQVKSELTSKIELLNQLKASILDSAFKGEL
ncbi:restriction endonuclease subunit S [uncultured Acinetobacter sp.]|uniref:restriction endonuclease subunit S n=1 Tax=uncultured Acinetobacter sp. TaxID=165433 RepID=UPI00258D411B|nr:restriction endonuclease subunit S [uncultured Acinetobacter sp.]